jgi:hypothetical protein
MIALIDETKKAKELNEQLTSFLESLDKRQAVLAWSGCEENQEELCDTFALDGKEENIEDLITIYKLS